MKELLLALRGELAVTRDPEDEHARVRDWMLINILTTLDKRLTKLEEEKKK